MEAISLAKKVGENRDYIETNKARAFIVKVKRQEMENNIDNWGRFIFLPNPKILSQFRYLQEGIIKIRNSKIKLPLTRLNNILETIGIDRHQFWDNFQQTSGEIPGSVNGIIGGGEEERIFMSTCPNSFLRPINSGERIFREKAGRLLVPDRTRVDTTHVFSFLSSERTLSNIFYSLRLREETEAKLKTLCLW